MVTLDVQNAFNTASWIDIIRELIKRKISPYIIKIIGSYLKDRNLQVTEDSSIEITRGVPQGSVLGPLLWNILYDELLRFWLPEGVTIVGYADDIVILVMGKSGNEIENRTNRALNIINKWMTDKKLKLAPNKTEAVILAGRRKLQSITLEIDDIRISSVEALKYLGVTFDRNMTMRKHVQNICERAHKIASQLRRIMPRIDGPSSQKRRILASVIYSIVLYAAPIWGKIIKYDKYRIILEKVQRQVMISICSAYRTTSTSALQVISNSIPIDLLVEERMQMYKKDLNLRKTDLREITTRKWQERWQNGTEKGVWTKTLIPSILPWIERKHGNISYHITQVLTNHGCFTTYLARIKRKETDKCWFCEEPDTAEHTLFRCPKWNTNRTRIEHDLKIKLNQMNIIDTMLESDEKWNQISGFIIEVMKNKEIHEMDMGRQTNE